MWRSPIAKARGTVQVGGSLFLPYSSATPRMKKKIKNS
jgi:hypothetical protein